MVGLLIEMVNIHDDDMSVARSVIVPTQRNQKLVTNS